MNNYVKSIARRALAKANRILTIKTDSGRIRSLLEKLYPVATDKNLIRLGPKGDGGYLIPNDLRDVSALLSAGVGKSSQFELDCADYGMEVFLADKSVEGPAVAHEQFHFTKKFIGVTSDDDYITLDEWVDSFILDQSSDLMLQMDIEGYEYEVLLSASLSLMQRCRIIVVEFHGLNNFWNAPYFRLASRVFDKILQTHSCLHIHPNNIGGYSEIDGLVIPAIMEFTFLRNDRFTNLGFQTEFPSSLDFDNSTVPAIVLPNCWYSQNSVTHLLTY